MNIAIKRAYDAPAPEDGFRILVDRLWPRGVSKEAARIDLWLKSVAPTDALRKWYRHDVQKWAAFKERYFGELDGAPQAVAELLGHVKKGPVTFVYSAREVQYNNAVALKAYVQAALSRSHSE